MHPSSFTRCLVGLCVTIAGAIFSVPCLGAQQPAAVLAEPEKKAEPLIVAPETLAQAVQDDVNAAARKYHLTELQLTGVVTKQSEYKGEVHSFQFDVMVNDRTMDKRVGFSIFFGLKEALPKGDNRINEFAAGKTVTVRGKSIAMGNGQVTLLYCVLVPKADKSAKKEDE